eukprot:gnl/MRDRNA2_/MRDRNA2_26015_c0_seq1.p1 gnl/MRDRNA2_/MRDRNA2_26015_c0~~gnl/MRDRNA2_/MRDRNA2_26015_c0_seq1.p1  ORF type:complete len:377 (-),score=62.60 gnl/MRDRNA2_/MRDRNA2_26015_c0_seq1:139-1269(-)
MDAHIWQGHSRTVQALVAFGDTVISASSDGAITKWHLTIDGKFEEKQSIPNAHGGTRVTCLVIVENSGSIHQPLLLSGGFDGKMRVWELPDLKCSVVNDVLEGLAIFAIAATDHHVYLGGGDDGKHVGGAMGIVPFENSFKNSAVHKGKSMHTDNIYALAAYQHPDSTKECTERIWSGGRDGKVLLHELVNGTYTQLACIQVRDVGESVRSICVTSESIFCGTRSGTLHVFDRLLAHGSKKFEGLHAGALYGMVARDAESKEPVLLTCSKDGRLCIVSGLQFRSEASYHELMIFPRLDPEKPAWGESFCLTSAHVICGARDGRLMMLPLANAFHKAAKGIPLANTFHEAKGSPAVKRKPAAKQLAANRNVKKKPKS